MAAVPSASAMDMLLLKDYRPTSSLVVTETLPAKAQFPVIDMHAHPIATNSEAVASWVHTMDAVGIQTTVILSGATRAQFDEIAALYLKPYPERFRVFCGLDISGIDAPDYSDRAVRELLSDYQQGARGVGEVRDKGAGLDMGSDAVTPVKQLHFDDKRLDPVWKKCAELGIPVSIHVADHPSAWQPPDNHQERSPSFQQFNLYGKDVLSYSELVTRRDQFFASHPDTVFIACHLANQGNDLGALASMLDRYPNVYVDISARDYELGRQPRTSAAFLTRYRSRILFGSDMDQSAALYRGWWRLLETPDEFIAGRVWWRLYGLALSPRSLKPLYRENALKVLKGSRP
jgi:predicted TIM-barrel fold metal-dependent hydrolase